MSESVGYHRVEFRAGATYMLAESPCEQSEAVYFSQDGRYVIRITRRASQIPAPASAERSEDAS